MPPRRSGSLTQPAPVNKNASLTDPMCRRQTVVPHVAYDEIQSKRAMANNASATKRIRQTAVRTARNQARKSRMRTFVKKVEQAIAGGDKAAAAEALRAAQPELQRGATKGVTHANTVARKLSRLSARIKAIAAG
jgi:small subunit ribosomal protein S20